MLTNTTLATASGDNVTCTFSNDDQPASLTLVKVVNNTIGTAIANDWTLNATLAGTSILNSTNGTAGVTSHSLSAGDYALSESAGPDGYSLESLVCDSGNSNSILSLTNGEEAVCTFTNRDTIVDLTITKSVDNLTPNIGAP